MVFKKVNNFVVDMNSCLFAKDPVIQFYRKMTYATERTEMPMFSETMLRLSLSNIIGAKSYPLAMSHFVLYRKLLLFTYANEYKTVEELTKIMICYSEDEIKEIIYEYDNILLEWRIFFDKNLKSVILKEAFYEMLFEWTKRYMHLYGTVDATMLRQKGYEIQKIMNWDCKFNHSWLTNFQTLLTHRNLKRAPNDCEVADVDDLGIFKILNDIKHKLNPIILELNANFILDDTEVPEPKNQQQLQVVKPVPKPTPTPTPTPKPTPIPKFNIKTVNIRKRSSKHVIPEELKLKQPHHEQTAISQLSNENFETIQIELLPFNGQDNAEKYVVQTENEDKTLYVNYSKQLVNNCENTKTQAKSGIERLKFGYSQVENADESLIDEIEEFEYLDNLFELEHANSDETYKTDNHRDKLKEATNTNVKKTCKNSEVVVKCKENEQQDAEYESNDAYDELFNEEEVTDYETAMKYLSALQNYAFVNEQIKAVELLQEVESLFQNKIA